MVGGLVQTSPAAGQVKGLRGRVEVEARCAALALLFVEVFCSSRIGSLVMASFLTSVAVM